MTLKKNILTFLAALAVCVCCGKTYGLGVPVDTPVKQSGLNLRDYINSRIAAGEKFIKIPEGVYRLSPAKGEFALLTLENLRDVQIDFGGSEIRASEVTRVLDVKHCGNLVVKNLFIDYDPLCFSQGKIVEMSDDKGEHIIELFENYPAAEMLSSDKYEIFDAATATLKTTTYFGVKAEVLGKNKIKVTKSPKYKYSVCPEEIGDVIVIASKQRAGHCVSTTDSENVRYQNVTVYAAPSFAFLDRNCSAIVYSDCSLVRRLKDYVKRVPRMRSGNADGFHSKDARVGPRVLNCRTEFNGDDSVAIHGTYQIALKSDGANLDVAGWLDFNVGDEVEIFNRSGKIEYAKVVAVRQTGKISGELLDKIEKTGTWRFFIDNKVIKKTYTLTLDKPVEVEPFSMVGNRNAIGDGFKIIGGHFGKNRSRGIILKCGKGEIRNANISASRMSCILVCPEWFWLEGAHSKDLLIENNTIEAGFGEAININSSTADSSRRSPAGAHRNIKIVGNRITYSCTPALMITSVENLELKNNTIVKVEGAASAYPQSTGGEVVKKINCTEKQSD